MTTPVVADHTAAEETEYFATDIVLNILLLSTEYLVGIIRIISWNS